MQTPSFVDPSVVAEQTARMLLEIEAVNFQTDPPFTLTSGKKSPSYIDCRKIISFPRVRSIMMDFAVSTLAREVGAEAFDAVAGGETGWYSVLRLYCGAPRATHELRAQEAKRVRARCTN